jgi:hypothetical protein
MAFPRKANNTKANNTLLTYLLPCLALSLMPIVSMGQKSNPLKAARDESLYQTRYGLAPQLGISLGATYCSIQENFFGTDPKFGFYGGIKAEYFFAPRWFIHTTLAYSQKGTVTPFQLVTSSGRLTEKTYHDKLRFSYIDFPVLFSYEWSLNKGLVNSVRIYPIAGIEQGYLIRAINLLPRLNQVNEVIYNRFDLLQQDTPRYINTEIKMHRYTMGLSFGAGTTFMRKGNYSLFAEARYAHYLTAVFETLGGSKIYNKGFTINTGVLF